LAATFVFGAGALIVNNRISAIKSGELADFQLRFEGEQQKTAHAQQEAAEAKALAGGFERDIATANRGAAEANERATKAQASLALAEQHSAEANAKAEGFRLDIAQANARAASANETAERERLARLQLEARLADRVITPDQKQRITEAFASMGGQTVDVVIVGDTPEVSRTADAILGCLQSAGVLMNFFHPFGGGGAQGVVVGIRADAPEGDKQAGAQLVSILRETLGGGVGSADSEKIVVSGTGTMGSTPGAGPVGKSPLRLQIAPK
jgi:hypothetical protein